MTMDRRTDNGPLSVTGPWEEWPLASATPVSRPTSWISPSTTRQVLVTVAGSHCSAEERQLIHSSRCSAQASMAGAMPSPASSHRPTVSPPGTASSSSSAVSSSPPALRPARWAERPMSGMLPWTSVCQDYSSWLVPALSMTTAESKEALSMKFCSSEW